MHTDTESVFIRVLKKIHTDSHMKIFLLLWNAPIANIKLVNRKHEYLRVVIRYGDIWQKLLGKETVF
ncbi:MAG: hypothetical protein GY749_17930 [Desulfobacteraceae bacterium]|nr:hypothetical protein [Desulfobacteraceae bacterium]